MIGPYFEGGAALDLFAGTGGLGIEALSRGMDSAVFVDMEQKSIDTVRANLKAAKLEAQAEVYRNDAGRALSALEKRGRSFDLVFLDPPYRLKHGDELMMAMAQKVCSDQMRSSCWSMNQVMPIRRIFRGSIEPDRPYTARRQFQSISMNPLSVKRL